MTKVRWNVRLGPLQFTSPMGALGAAILAGAVLTCCCAGVVGVLD